MAFYLSTGNKAIPSASATVTSVDGDSCTIKITAGCYLTNGYVYSTGVVAKFYVNGSLKSTQTILGNKNNYTAPAKKTKSYSFTVNKKHTAQTVTWKVCFHEFTDGTDTCSRVVSDHTNGIVYINGSYSIAAKTSYNVTYNGNGTTTNVPASQTKWYGETLALRTGTPTRTGYSFKNWNTASAGTGTTYAPGASYTKNSALTLYAQWTANTYNVTFNSDTTDTVTNMPSTVQKTYGVALTLPTNVPVRSGYNFLGWNTYSGAESALYSAGDTLPASVNKTLTLYAVWELAYWKPRPVNNKINAKRCDSTGTADDFGACIKVGFNYECCTVTDSSNVVTSIDISSETSSVSFTPNVASGTIEGTSAILTGPFDVDTTYTITVTMTDSTGETATYTKTVSPAKWPLDFLGSSDLGVSVGKIAELAGYLDVALKLLVRLGIYGENSDGTIPTAASFIPRNTNNHTLINYAASATRDGYTASTDAGNTYIYGDEVEIRSNNDSFIVDNIQLAAVESATCTLEDGWTPYTSGENVQVFRYGKFVFLSGTLKNTAAATYGTTQTAMFTVPSGFRPAAPVRQICQGTNYNRWVLSINTGGAASIQRCGTTTYPEMSAGCWFPFSASWIIP